MRFARSGNSFKHYQPKRNFWSLKNKKRRLVAQHEDAPAWSLNPYRRLETKKRSFAWLKKSLLPVLGVGWLLLLLYLPYFRVNRVEVAGVKIIKAEEIERLVRDQINERQFLPNDNYFLVSENNVSNIINKNFSLNAVTVTKIFPRTIQVVVEEKISSAIAFDGTQYALLDQNGVVLKELSLGAPPVAPQAPTSTTSSAKIALTSKSVTSTAATSTTPSAIQPPQYQKIADLFGAYPVIFIREQVGLYKDAQAVDTEVAQGIINFYNDLERSKLAHINYIEQSAERGGVVAYVNKTWKIFFKPENNIAQQIENLRTILQENKPTEYVDLRFAERVYWK